METCNNNRNGDDSAQRQVGPNRSDYPLQRGLVLRSSWSYVTPPEPDSSTVAAAASDVPATIIMEHASDPPSILGSPSFETASSGATTLSQQLAMEAYIESPTPERWQVLVQSIADERRAKGGSSSRRRRRRQRRPFSPDGDIRSVGSGDSGSVRLPISSVEFPTPPKQERGPLEAIEEDESSGQTSSECEELELIAALDQEGVYEESDAATERIEEDYALTLEAIDEDKDSSTPTSAQTSSDCEELELIADSDHEGVYEESDAATTQIDEDYALMLTPHTVVEYEETELDEDAINRAELELIAASDQEGVYEESDATTYQIEEDGAWMSTPHTVVEYEEMEAGEFDRAVRFVAFDEEGGGAAEEIEMVEAEETYEAPMSVEDIIADLNISLAEQSDSSSDKAQRSFSLAIPHLSPESRPTTSDAAPGGIDPTQADGVLGQSQGTEVSLTAPPSSTLVPPKNDLNGANAPSVVVPDGVARDALDSNESVHGAVPVQNDDAPSPRWKSQSRYTVWGVLVCVAAILAIGVAFSTRSSASSDNEVSVRMIRSTFQPSTSPAPSRLPSLRPSVVPSSSFLPSTHLSSLPWRRYGQTIGGTSRDDWLGWSAALSSDGTIVAVGAPGPFDAADRPGRVAVYRRKSGRGAKAGWERMGSDLAGAADGDLFGQAVALSSDGKILAVGAPGYFGRGDRPGYVRVYRLAEGTEEGTRGAVPWRRDDGSPGWARLGPDIPGEADGDMFGMSVALSADGRTVAVGANGNDRNGDSSGHVRVHRLDGTGSGWERLGRDISGDAVGDNAGKSLDLSADGSILAIGSPFNDGNGDHSGHVRVYRMEDGADSTWEQLGQDVEGAAAGDWSGRSVSLSADGKTLAVGANGNDGNGDNAGHARVYRLEGDVGASTWKQLGEDIGGDAAGDQSGVSVSLSADGTTLAVGANGHDGNGVSSGRVRVYRAEGADVGSSWTRLGRDIDGEAASDNSGFSVALSADGETVAVGSPWHSETNGDKSGHVRVFDFQH